MEWKVENVPELRGYTIEWAEENNFYLSRRNILYHSENLKPPFKQIAVIAAPFWKQAVSNFRLAQRLLRFQVTNVIPLKNDDLFVTFDKSIGVVRGGKFKVLEGLARPCRVLRAACAVDENGDVFFGEYLDNRERGEMRVYKFSPENDFLEVVHVFPPATIRHIHGLYRDEFSNSIFCLTGDADQECKIIKTANNFQTTKIVGQGDETWRAVSILFKPEAMYFGMDAEFSTNQIFKLNRDSKEKQSLGEVSGTVFYSKKIGEDLFFTTTAESAPSQTENVAALWYIDENDKLEQLVSFKKDRWHPTFFQFGTIHFPFVNKFDDKLYFHLVGVEEDNQVFVIKSAK